MRFPYYDLSDRDFERLVLGIGAELLGPGIAGFSSGPDGARDARFSGTAARFPGANQPYSGQFILQAKHTEHPFAKFSDTDFSGEADSSILTKEIPKIKNLVQQGELDIYMLFSNRRMAGVADQKLRQDIASKTGAKAVELFGIERIDLQLRLFKTIVTTSEISLLNAPMIVNPDDLAEIIAALDKDKSIFQKAATPSIDQVQRVTFANKNKTNGLSADFSDLIKSRYLPFFDSVKSFLEKPGNDEIRDRYEDACAEFQDQITAHRASHLDFDKVLVRLQDLLFGRDSDLSRKKKLTKLVIYYMYWNCDIGKI